MCASCGARSATDPLLYDPPGEVVSVFHAEDGSLDRLESIRAPDGREGHWTRWFAAEPRRAA